MLMTILSHAPNHRDILRTTHLHASRQMHRGHRTHRLSSHLHLDGRIAPLVLKSPIPHILHADVFGAEERRLALNTFSLEGVEGEAEHVLREDPEDNHHAALRVSGAFTGNGQSGVRALDVRVHVGGVEGEGNDLALVEVFPGVAGEYADERINRLAY